MLMYTELDVLWARSRNIVHTACPYLYWSSYTSALFWWSLLHVVYCFNQQPWKEHKIFYTILYHFHCTIIYRCKLYFRTSCLSWK